LNIVQPNGVLDGEPRVLILQLSERVADLDQHIGILNIVVGIMYDEQSFRVQLGRPNQLVVVISILAEEGAPEFIGFGGINFQQYQSVQEYINVLFTNLNQYIKVERNLQGQEQTRLISGNDDTLRWILIICSKAFFSNLRYWKNQFFQGQNGPHTEFFRKQWLQRVEIQDYVTTQLIKLS
jgi:hypothetical protein